MVLCKFVRRNYGRKLLVSIKYQNFHSFKERLILMLEYSWNEKNNTFTWLSSSQSLQVYCLFLDLLFVDFTKMEKPQAMCLLISVVCKYFWIVFATTSLFKTSFEINIDNKIWLTFDLGDFLIDRFLHQPIHFDKIYGYKTFQVYHIFFLKS